MPAALLPLTKNLEASRSMFSTHLASSEYFSMPDVMQGLGGDKLKVRVGAGDGDK